MALLLSLGSVRRRLPQKNLDFAEIPTVFFEGHTIISVKLAPHLNEKLSDFRRGEILKALADAKCDPKVNDILGTSTPPVKMSMLDMSW